MNDRMIFKQIQVDNETIWVSQEKVEKGDIIWWEDPAGETSSKAKVEEIYENNTMLLTGEYGTEIEAFEDEVYKIITAQDVLSYLLKDVSRVEVISNKGREYVKYGTVKVMLQNEGKTLKLDILK